MFIENIVEFYTENKILARTNCLAEREEIKMNNTQRCCPKFLGRFPAVANVGGETLVLTLQNVCCQQIIQGDKISFYIPQCFDYPQTIGNVVVKINDTNFGAFKFGNLKSDQIKKRTCYTGVIGTEQPSITLISDVCPSKFDYPNYSTTCTTSEV